MDKFDLRKFLAENKTSNKPKLIEESRLVHEFAKDSAHENIIRAVETLESMYLELEDDKKRKKLAQDLTKYVLNQLMAIE